ncbi:hypothetical protein K488DRAFT_70603 [Vararia minispora EC-137]|uniref:Uncharacterized protein n=1 Tax=Vararia minispora EC-137 TaxID=1314806 RepID=A0ACB8QM93_9AGAM|nr:hypothetical protein K488DRAFT_70603 [Vararia minispora EC-137]
MSTDSPPLEAPSIENLWKDAFKTYKDIVGHEFPKNSLGDRLTACKTTEDIYKILEEEEGKFKAFREKGQKIRDYLAPFVRVVELFNDTGAEVANATGVPGGKAIFVGFGVLLSAAKGVSDAYDGLEKLMTKLGSFLNRATVHLAAPVAPDTDGLTAILVRILAELLRVFALVTKYLERNVSKHRTIRQIQARVPNRVRHFFERLMGEQDIADALARLDALTQDEQLRALADARRAGLEAKVNAEAAKVNAEAARSAAERAALGTDKEFTERGVPTVEAGVKAVQELQIDHRIAEWLSAPNPFFNHDHLRDLRQSRQTAEWIFGEKFKEWESSEDGVYWIYGKPGSGKSVLCSSIIDALLGDPELMFAFFYFDFRDPSKQNERDLLASLVLQFGKRSESLHSRLVKFHSSHSDTVGHADKATLTLCLKDMLQESGPVCIILDALDEWPDARDKEPRHRILRPLLSRLRTLGSHGARLLITSRPEQDIRELMVPLVPYDLALHDADAQAEAIRTFIRDELSSDMAVTDYRDWSPALKEEVATELVSKAGGICALFVALAQATSERH